MRVPAALQLAINVDTVLQIVKRLDTQCITLHVHGMTNETPVMSLRVPLDLKDELQRLADADQRSLSNYIVKALRDHVETRSKSKGRR